MTVVAHGVPESLRAAAAVLDRGELAVVPTDTLYALACDALDEDAIARVFDAKRRPADQALPVCVAGLEDVHHVAHLSPLARRLAEVYWPGAVTLVLRAKPCMPDILTAGSGTIAVRAPAHPFSLGLARAFGPYTVSSANRHHEPAPSTLAAARVALGSDVSLYVDGGALPGTPSTIVDVTGPEARVLREGAVAAAEIATHAAHPRGD